MVGIVVKLLSSITLFAVLVLEWYERKILLAGWWLEAGAEAM